MLNNALAILFIKQFDNVFSGKQILTVSHSINEQDEIGHDLHDVDNIWGFVEEFVFVILECDDFRDNTQNRVDETAHVRFLYPSIVHCKYLVDERYVKEDKVEEAEDELDASCLVKLI